MKRVVAALLLLALLSVTACGDGSRQDASPPAIRSLEDALEVRHGDATLRELLNRVGSSHRGTADAVLAAYAELGPQASRWLAEAAAAGVPSDRAHAFRVLDSSREIAREAVPVLARWLGEESVDRVLKVRFARLLLEIDESMSAARRVYRTAIRSSRSEELTEAMLGLGFLGRAGIQFAPDLLAAAESDVGEVWNANVVSYLDRVGPVPTELQAQLDRVRRAAGQTFPEPPIDTGDR